MRFEELKTHWQAAAPNGIESELDVRLVSRVKARSRRFDRRVKRRDWIETLAAAAVVVFFLWAFTGANWISRVGILIVIVSSALIAWRFHRTRKRHPDAAPDRSVAQTLRAEIAKRDAQIHLLESIHWWYLAPLTLGVITIFAGAQGLSWPSLIYAVVVMALAAVLYYVNQICVRRDLKPDREDLQGMLAHLQSPPSGDNNSEDC